MVRIFMGRTPERDMLHIRPPDSGWDFYIAVMAAAEDHFKDPIVT
jgi:hypothetical protein